MSAAAHAKQLVFIPDDTHWTSEGHRVVAAALDEALTAVGQAYPAGRDMRSPTHRNIKVDIASDAMIVRNMDGTIRYWSDGAARLYGWKAQSASGEVSPRLLKTVFPVPLQIIEAEWRANGYWEGKLIHERRDGAKVSVSSHWELQQNLWAKDQSVTVVEIHTLLAS